MLPAREPWGDWVLHGEDYRACPGLSGAMPGERAAHVCAWPGELGLDAPILGAAELAFEELLSDPASRIRPRALAAAGS